MKGLARISSGGIHVNQLHRFCMLVVALGRGVVYTSVIVLIEGAAMQTTDEELRSLRVGGIVVRGGHHAAAVYENVRDVGTAGVQTPGWATVDGELPAVGAARHGWGSSSEAPRGEMVGEECADQGA